MVMVMVMTQMYGPNDVQLEFTDLKISFACPILFTQQSLTSLLTSPTITSAAQPSLSYPYPSSDAWSTNSNPTQIEQGQWTYSHNHNHQSQGQSLTLPSIHSLDSNTFGTNNQGPSSTTSSPVPFHMMMSSLTDLQNQYHLTPIASAQGSSVVNLTHIHDSNTSSSNGFRSWTDSLFDSVSDNQNIAAHDSFSQVPNLSQLSSMDPWSPTSPALGPSLSHVTSFQAYVQQVQQNSLSLSSSSSQRLSSIPPTPAAMPPPPPPPSHSRQEKDRTNRGSSNTSARERELNAAIVNPIPRHTYTRTLVGPLSANAQRLQDEHRKPAIFFLFQDLSIRTEGTFRLRMRLMSVGEWVCLHFSLPCWVLLHETNCKIIFLFQPSCSKWIFELDTYRCIACPCTGFYRAIYRLLSQTVPWRT